MSQYGSWSVKGVDDRARAVAKEKARMKGVTLGDYINNLLLEGHSEARPRDFPYDTTTSRPVALDGLAQRIEAVEARSTLAITGIDQSVLGLLARLENTENSTSAMAAEVERMIDELRETHEMLQDKVQTLETDDSGKHNLEAMKALEDALGKLASHVYEESRLTQDESAAMKGRVESGFSDMAERVDGIELKVESTLSDAAKRVEKAVEQAELRAEGTSRHLSERFSAIENSVTNTLAKVDEVDSRMRSVEGDVSGALSSMESTLARIQDRLQRAENTTDSALKALEHTFANVDQRIDTVAAMANPEQAESWRRQFEERFDALAEDLRSSVEQSRLQLADEIERAAAGANPDLMGSLEARVHALEAEDVATSLDGLGAQIKDLSSTLDQHVVEAELRNAAAIEQVGEQVGGLSQSFDDRIRASEERSAAAIQTVGDRVEQLSATVDQRVVESERRSASAIEQVGEQVATAIKHVQARQEQAQRTLDEKLSASEVRHETRLSDALANISDRLADMQSQTKTAVSPVQRAILSLASRLEALEDFTAPPLASNSSEPLPKMREMEVDQTPIALEPTPDYQAAPEPEPEGEQVSASIDAPTETEDADYLSGLPDFDAADATPDALEDPVEQATDDPYSMDTLVVEESEDAIADATPEDDPLTELGSWDEAQEEARDSDVFGDELDPAAEAAFASDEETPEDLAEFLPDYGDEELAHNTDDLDEAGSDLLEDTQDGATDYLSRARQAAIAAADDPKSGSKLRRGRRSAASATPKTGKSGARKFPIMAAASVFALAAAGAGGWVALRGKQIFTETSDAPTIVTKSSLVASNEATLAAAEEPSLTGVEFAEAPLSAAVNEALEEDLFEEGSTAGIGETATPVETVAAAAPTETPDLPEIPMALTLERAALNGNPIAQFKWGLERHQAQDHVAAAEFIGRAAEQGLPAAQYQFAKLHERGLGVPRDFKIARSWTERAANGGNILAMHDLAVFFADGEGGSQSYAAAAEWTRKAADFGVVDSQYNMALMYENGLGISPSQVEALYWYEIAAASGDASAPGNVATLREALPLDKAQQAQRRASVWTVSRRDPEANGEFGSQTWDRSTQAQVVAIQTVLNGLGYDAGAPDGVAGAGTRTAIRAFQADSGLETDGEISDALVAALNAQAQGLAG